MFARYVFDIKSALQVGQNTIRVAFQSPVEYAQINLKSTTHVRIQVVPEFLAPAYRGENQAQMIRKCKQHFLGTGSILPQLRNLGDQNKLWWPNGYGEQNLYWYNVTLESETTSDSTTRMLRFGREFTSLLMAFRCTQGIHSIPPRAYGEITKEQTEWLLRAAKMSHQNMIEWGVEV
ncbi:Beta-mannosidase [Orchesella cincta]|uniref:beta-mannosidase n=1 Tax=Orchesella cincta TaxID=48709 RepID=A0A1D2M0L3_ORCCI|nr:Beta-mannosidase [Orchesella cincta]